MSLSADLSAATLTVITSYSIHYTKLYEYMSEIIEKEAIETYERFEKEYIVPSRALFWTQDLGVDDSGNMYSYNFV